MKFRKIVFLHLINSFNKWKGFKWSNINCHHKYETIHDDDDECKQEELRISDTPVNEQEQMNAGER
jgi:hypothetical protein